MYAMERNVGEGGETIRYSVCEDAAILQNFLLRPPGNVNVLFAISFKSSDVPAALIDRREIHGEVADWVRTVRHAHASADVDHDVAKVVIEAQITDLETVCVHGNAMLVQSTGVTCGPVFAVEEVTTFAKECPVDPCDCRAAVRIRRSVSRTNMLSDT